MSPTITELVANFFLASEKLIRRNVRVGDLLFDGFDVSTYSKNPLLASQLPEEFSNHRFGLYKGVRLSMEFCIICPCPLDPFHCVDQYFGVCQLHQGKRDTFGGIQCVHRCRRF